MSLSVDVICDCIYIGSMYLVLASVGLYVMLNDWAGSWQDAACPVIYSL